jgi:hypothetical protein
MGRSSGGAKETEWAPEPGCSADQLHRLSLAWKQREAKASQHFRLEQTEGPMLVFDHLVIAVVDLDAVLAAMASMSSVRSAQWKRPSP